jgi:hypothetical protein
MRVSQEIEEAISVLEQQIVDKVTPGDDEHLRRLHALERTAVLETLRWVLGEEPKMAGCLRALSGALKPR